MDPKRASPGVLAYCALCLIAALYVVGFVSHGILRHVVQTAPSWLTVVLGLRRSPWSRWAALPCFLVWLFVMILIWLFLLGWAHLVSGTFSPAEIAMTLVVGAASITGVGAALRMKGGASRGGAAALFVGVLLLQALALWVSLQPGIAHD